MMVHRDTYQTEIDVEGVSELVLSTSQLGSTVGDSAVWLDPILTRK